MDDAASRPRIFCIGLNKTGTSSVHRALEMLGYSSLHWGGPQVQRAMARAARRGLPLLSGLDEQHDAYSDIGWLSHRFDIVDAQYPGSKFILTIRDTDQWIDSRRRHIERNIARRAAGEYDGNFLVVDPTAWWHEYRQHGRRVSQHFAGRPNDLLVLDVCAGEGWEALCPFLGQPIPDTDFPRENRDRSLSRAPG